jgi:hypothetical protein
MAPLRRGFFSARSLPIDIRQALPDNARDTFHRECFRLRSPPLSAAFFLPFDGGLRADRGLALFNASVRSAGIAKRLKDEEGISYGADD